MYLIWLQNSVKKTAKKLLCQSISSILWLEQFSFVLNKKLTMLDTNKILVLVGGWIALRHM